MDIIFDTYKREGWLKIISSYVDMIPGMSKDEDIVMHFPGLTREEMLPLHVVSLACLIQSFYQDGFHHIFLDKTDVGNYLFDKLRFKEYWAGKKDYVASPDQKIFNLWRISDETKENYGRAIADYLKCHFWKNKDLTSVQVSITEACYNTLDHANANGNAFSFVKYDEVTQTLSVAVCDFGIGIARSVQGKLPECNDEQALEKSIEVNFTVGSKSYNGGMGLDVIRNSVTKELSLTIISNSAFLITKEEKVRTSKLDFEFRGTLIDFSINLSEYEDADEELIDEISF